jgi:hypothetical protein
MPRDVIFMVVLMLIFMVVHVGPNKKGCHSYDKFCVFPNRVALNSSQVNYLKKVAKARPTIPLYVCTIQEANLDDTKGKMVKLSVIHVMMCFFTYE